MLHVCHILIFAGPTNLETTLIYDYYYSPTGHGTVAIVSAL